MVQGDVVRATDFPRVSFSKKDGSITIKDINSYDDTTFRCRAFTSKDRFETLVHVHVNSPPRGIRIGHNVNLQKNIAEQTLSYRAGEKDLRFKCNVAKARPEAKINWNHNGNTILESQGKDHDLKVEDEGLLIIKTLHARHAGDYECEASNDFGTLKASFKIEAQCESSSYKACIIIVIFLSFRSTFLHASSQLFQRRRRQRRGASMRLQSFPFGQICSMVQVWQ